MYEHEDGQPVSETIRSKFRDGVVHYLVANQSTKKTTVHQVLVQDRDVYGTEDFRVTTVSRYIDELTNSVFCFVSRGVTLWTRRLFESILGGCIPVLLNDHVVLPFEDWIDYNRFLIRLPESAVRSVLPILESLSPAAILAKQLELERVKHFFCYHHPHRPNDAFSNILHQLQIKAHFLNPTQNKF